jgi:hypothetical protein
MIELTYSDAVYPGVSRSFIEFTIVLIQLKSSSNAVDSLRRTFARSDSEVAIDVASPLMARHGAILVHKEPHE